MIQIGAILFAWIFIIIITAFAGVSFFNSVCSLLQELILHKMFKNRKQNLSNLSLQVGLSAMLFAALLYIIYLIINS